MASEMTVSDEIIMTLHPEGKRGIKIRKDTFIEIATVLIQHIERSEDVSLAALIKNAEEQLRHHPETVQLCYHVKLDLETRGYIRMTSSPTSPGTRVLQLTPKAKQTIKRYASLKDSL